MAKIIEMITKAALKEKIDRKENLRQKLSVITEMTFEDMETYVENNVTNLPTAKEYLKKMAKALKALTELVLEEKE